MTDLTIAPLKPVPAQTATDQVFESLYKAVISLQLPPGTKVSEAEIARQLDVSRQPVRDAFFRLSKLGFLSIRPQRATLITKISEIAVLDAAFIRTAIEVECMRICAERRTGDDLASLRDSLERQAASFDAEDPALFHDRDDDFHRRCCAIAGHAHAWDLIQEQKAHMDRVRYLTLSEHRRRQVHAEHQAIVAAIEAQDIDATERLLRAHLGDIGNAVRSIRAEHMAYFEDVAG